MLDKINGISNIDVSNSLHFDSFNNTDSPGLNVDVSGKSGGNSPPSGKLEEVMPILVKLIEQLTEMLQSDSAEDSTSAEGEAGDNVVPAAEESGSSGHLPSGEEDGNKGAETPMEGGAAAEKSTAGSGDMSAPEGGGESSISGELGEIMTMLVKLIEQLMKMLQQGSTEASSEEKGGDSAATPAEGGGASESAASSDSSAATGEGESSMGSESGEVMQPLAALVEQLMKMLQGDSASAKDSASGEDVGGNSAASPMEGSAASEPSSAESGETPAAMGGELGEIMQLLTQLVEQLMAMLQGDSAKDSAPAEGAESGGAAPSTEGSGSSDHSPAADGEHADKAAAPMESGMAPEASSAESGEAPAAMSGELGEILQLLTQLIEQLMAMLEGDSAEGSASAEGAGSGSAAPSAEGSGSSGHSPSGSSESNNGAVTPAEGGIKPEASSASSGHIPAPTEHLQSFDLGGKPVTIGGDGSASAAEVQSTAESIQGLYQNSDTFRSMIDSSSDQAFEVSVGKRDDNTSWGNSEGRVFMNINNVEPGNSDTFQSLLGHEFAHASIDIGHGSRMEQLESTIAAEA